MSVAPSSAYQTNKAQAGLASGSTTFSQTRDLLLAKFLQNTTPKSGDDWGDGYFNSTDTEAQKIAKIKDIFKIDGWIRIEQGGGVQGFVGYCNSKTSGNGLYHNWDNNTSPFIARGSGVKLDTTTISAELLNDAGLNRKPHSEVIQNDANQVWWANMYSVRVLCRSAFYTKTQRVGYDYKINSGAWQRGSTQIIDLASKTPEYYEFRQQDFGANQGDTIYLKAFATNEEGERIDETIYSHALAEKIVHLLAFKVTNINDTTGTSTEIFMTQPDFDLIADLTTSSQSLGIEGFTSDLMSTEIADGYYKGLDANNPNRVFTYSGEFTKYDVASGTDSEGLPTGMPRLYKSFAFQLDATTGVGAIGQITDGSQYLNVIAISVSATSISANVQITGTYDGLGTGDGRNADVYLRRTNSVTPSVNEDIFIGTYYIEPNVQFSATFTASLGSAVIDYDKFSFIEII